MLHQIVVVLEEIVAKNAHGCAPFNANFKTGSLSGAVAGEVDKFAVPAPAAHVVGTTVKGELLYFAPFGRHQVHIAIVVLSASKCNPFPIRGNPGVVFVSLHGG